MLFIVITEKFTISHDHYESGARIDWEIEWTTRIFDSPLFVKFTFFWLFPISIERSMGIQNVRNKNTSPFFLFKYLPDLFQSNKSGEVYFSYLIPTNWKLSQIPPENIHHYSFCKQTNSLKNCVFIETSSSSSFADSKVYNIHKEFLKVFFSILHVNFYPKTTKLLPSFIFNGVLCFNFFARQIQKKKKNSKNSNKKEMKIGKCISIIWTI